jgi:hypothetical protein
MWQLLQLQARHMVLDNSCSSITEMLIYSNLWLTLYACRCACGSCSSCRHATWCLTTPAPVLRDIHIYIYIYIYSNLWLTLFACRCACGSCSSCRHATWCLTTPAPVLRNYLYIQTFGSHILHVGAHVAAAAAAGTSHGA